jgi:hypothetical protein
MLGKGAALSNLPYTAYQGPLTAGASDLQSQAFQGLGALQVPGSEAMAYNPMSFTGAAYAPPTAQQAAAGQQGAYTPASDSVVQQYMTPYLQSVLDPQYAAARRQADISQQQLQGQYGKAGAYGGSRQGVAEAELQRGLLDRLSGITGEGYEQAFKQAQGQFNTEEDRRRLAAEQASRLGFDILDKQSVGGETQRGIEQSGIAADLAQFEFERDYPQRQVQFMQSLLQGQPLETQSYSYSQPTGAQGVGDALNAGLDIAGLLAKYLTPKTSAATTTTGNIIGEMEGN